MCTDFLEREEWEIKVRWRNERAEGKQARQRNVEHVKGRVEDRKRESRRFFDYSGNEGISAKIPTGRSMQIPDFLRPGLS